MLVSALVAAQAHAVPMLKQQQQQPCVDPATLILGGAHHRVGSEMLTRTLGALCKACFPVRRWKQSGPYVIDAETSSRQHGATNISAILQRYRKDGLRLLTSGRWSIAPSKLARTLDGAAVHWRMVHLIRPPQDAVLSAYLYHLNTSEPWALVVDPPWYSRMGLSPQLPVGLCYQQQLRRLNSSAGIRLQAQHSLRLLAQMVAVAEQCDALPACTNVWLDDFEADFDTAAASLLRALGVERRLIAGRLLPTLRRAGKLSDAKRRASAHVTRGKDEARRAALSSLLDASAFAPALRRLHTRLLALRGGPANSRWHADVARSGRHESALREAPRTPRRVGAPPLPRNRCVWSTGDRGWWSSGEPVRVVEAAHSPAAETANYSVAGTGADSRDACCEACLSAVDPGCLHINYRSRTPTDDNAKCVLLSSRLAFHRSRHATTADA